MHPEQPVFALRRTLLAASVIDDIDVVPMDTGVILDGPVSTELGWGVIAEAIGEHPHDSEIARLRLSTALRLHSWLAIAGTAARDELRMSARLLALGPDHALHPGPGWVRDRVLGGALECGIGLVADSDSGAESIPLPPSVVAAAGLDPDELYASLLGHADSMGELAVSRMHRDTKGPAPRGVSASDSQATVRPVGGLDVPSLLATRPVRAYLAGSDGSGMRAIAVPVRSRGWYDLARIDPAFVQAAWAASTESDRGLPRSLLVTTDEVVLGPECRSVIDLALADPAIERAGMTRSVRFR